MAAQTKEIFTNKNRLCNETACINPKNYLLESIGYS